MSSTLRWLASPVLLLLTASQLWADAGPPCIVGFFRRGQPDPRFNPPDPRNNAPDPQYDLEIVRDPNVKQAELRIPCRMMLAQAAGPGVSTRHAMAGLAISVGFVGAGLWCLRFRGAQIPRKKLIVAGVMALLLVGGVTIVSVADANAPPPQYLPPVVELGDVEVNVVVVDEGNSLQLVLPPNMADKVNAP